MQNINHYKYSSYEYLLDDKSYITVCYSANQILFYIQYLIFYRTKEFNSIRREFKLQFFSHLFRIVNDLVSWFIS